ncbi:mannose-6-phosphate isomerase, class I [Membranicola marinus]|uniref:mannose-6-phosphate isomerase n=1 Tax=Membranihabitans marinus TaxID=1227546 RepID=A0A953LCD9_9BACT|nr:mannose-6-phosphate isomerase, class I [Membranihabitans marinus]MBY5957674.1 mannose-6-phosphate isomerase, class I [Membranihabitans marinus]
MAILNKDTLCKLTGCVQNYPWGGVSYIPELLCQSNERQVPFAELWFGQHPACPSKVVGGTSLGDYLATSPDCFLTPAEREQWQDELPFLCKILDVRDMLSIQIHPTKTQAMEGWDLEEHAGVAIGAPNRTFRDRNHKPEIMYALSEFYLLHDFRSDEEILEVLNHRPPLGEIAEEIRKVGLPTFYRSYMQLDQKTINSKLQSFVRYVKRLEVTEDLLNPDYWVKQALKQYCTPEKIDRGIISFYLMNLVHLSPGEVMFQDSGIPHAYLRGQNVEIMANSDNVIRGGLTFKHIDAKALSRLVCFDERTVHYLEPNQVDASRKVFVPPVQEFEFSVIDLVPNREYIFKASGVSFLFSTCNNFFVSSQHQNIRVTGGEGVLARAGQKIALKSKEESQIFLVNPRS